jgi:tripartite-type tricarboxylate transporter receptor subunit TctC
MTQSRRNFVATLGALAATPVWAQTPPAFPNKVIRIVPFGTGGGPIDTLARAYADKLSARWGQPVIVDAKPGASGIIAADFVAKAPADGHTVMMTLPLTHVNVPILQAKTALRPGQGLHAAVHGGHRRADDRGAGQRAVQQPQGVR